MARVIRSRRVRLIAALLALVASPSPAVASVALASNTPGVFRGRTAQGIQVRLGPLRLSTRAFRYQARMACSDGSTFLDDPFTDQVRVRHGRFASRFVSSGGAVVTTVTGTLRGRRARGTIRIVERYSEIPNPDGTTPLAADGGILCDSQTVHWTATARG